MHCRRTAGNHQGPRRGTIRRGPFSISFSAGLPDMNQALAVSIGQWSDKGKKPINQDFHGAMVPENGLLQTKGVALAIADGISTSSVSQVAAESSVAGFLEDYFSTSEAWSVKRSAQRVISATNSWLHAQNQQSQYRLERDHGYVCTLSVLVLRQRTAQIFHVGDSRIYRLQGKSLEQLTQDHRVWMGGEQSYLARAMGVQPQVDIDHLSFALEPGEVYLLATDGAYEHLEGTAVADALATYPQDLNAAARQLVELALLKGSEDNLTLQIVRIDQLPPPDAGGLASTGSERALPLPPALQAGTLFDGYTIVRELHQNHRSQVFLATDDGTGQRVVLKVPSTEMKADPTALEHFLLEEWVARRVHSPHLVKAHRSQRSPQYLYVALEYVEGQTLEQWKADHPTPTVEEVRDIIEQVAKGLQAMHRMEMIHQDVRPANVIIDANGTARLLDFGSTRVAGLADIARPHAPVPGFAQYAAPEFFLGDTGTPAADLFSLAVMTYELLCGRLPYGLDLVKTRTLAEQRKLAYQSVIDERRPIPPWLDPVLRKALHVEPHRRHQEVVEFAHELRHAPASALNAKRLPIAEAHPVLLWKMVSLILALITLGLLATHPIIRGG